MKKHKFHDKDNEGNWEVTCTETGGSFSTAIWRTGKVSDQHCPCCNQSAKQ
jgi:hypothetical protein